jgi:hypothetical protein
MDANSKQNRNIGVTFIALITLGLLIIYVNIGITGGIDNQIIRATGGDFIVDMFDEGSKSNMAHHGKAHSATGGYEKLPGIDKDSMDATLHDFSE